MTVLAQKRYSSDILTFVCLSLLGCGFITFCSFVRIPFFPIAFTMHTFAIFLLAIVQTPRQALGSVLCYLLCGTLGLPVFAGHVNCLWFLGKAGGYYLSYPIAVYLTAKLSEKWPKLLAMLLGTAIIYLLGFIWLSFYFGPTIAFLKGVLIFLPSDLLKLFAVLSLISWSKVWAPR
jgi:biotin transport system substrate-specific component